MKRTIAMLFAALLMVLTVPTTAKAADDVTLTITVDKSTVNPGDTVTFTVSIGPVGQPPLGGLEFDLVIPEGLTIVDESVSLPEGLEETLDSDGEIVVPRNGWPKWSYSAQSKGYTGTSQLQILTFSCTVDENVGLGDKSMGMSVETCFDNDVLDEFNTIVTPASFTVKKASVPVSGVTLDQNKLTLKEGESAKLKATVAPADADNTAVKWASDNSSIATVAADGTVTALKSGTAKITVTTEDGGKTASCAVTVTCAHVMEKVDAVAPTCGRDGNIEHYTCSKCGKKYADEAGTKEIKDTTVPATGQHGETEVRGVVEATEEKDGYTGDTYCKVCGNKISAGTVIPKLSHTHVMVKTEAVKADCEKDGNVEYYTCSKCRKKFADEAGTKELTNVVIRATGHTGDGWRKDEESHWKVCSVCGKEFDKKAHDYKWVVDKAATEDETGLSHEECGICGSKRSEGTVTDKLDHVHTMIKTDAVKPGCEKDGNVEYYTCSKCRKRFADKDGTKELTDVVIKATGHTGGDWLKDEESHWKVCSVCGKEFDKESHTYKWVVDKEATEAEGGLAHEECGGCGSIRSEGTVTDKPDHVHAGIQHHEAVASNCLTKGNVEYWTCSSEECKEKYYGDAACQVVLKGIETPVNPDSHVGNGKWDSTAEKHTYTCACGEVLTEEAHKYDSDSDSDCDVCGYKRFYVVISGAGAVYETGAENGLTITADGDYGLFKELQVDGSLVDTVNYEVKEGSTVVTLMKAYMDALSSGEHTICFVYTDGKEASAGFMVKKKDGTGNSGSDNIDSGNGTNNNTDSGNDADNSTDTGADAQEQGGVNSPETGDENRLIFWSLLAVTSLGLITGIAVYGSKGKKR